MSRNITFAKIDELGLQVPISWNGSRWIIVSDNIPDTTVNGVYRVGNRDYFLVLDPDERGRLNGDPNQLVSTLWRLDHQSGQLVASRDFSGEGVTGLVQKVSRYLPARPQNHQQALHHSSGLQKPPSHLYFETPMEEIQGLRADFERGSSSALITLISQDTGHHFTVTILKSKEGKLSIAENASLNWGDSDFECKVSPLSGGRTYEVMAGDIKYYLYVTEDGGPVLTQVGPGELGLIPTKKELNIAYQLSQTTGKDRGPLKLALKEEINKRPLPSDLEMVGAIPRGGLKAKSSAIKLVGNGGYFAKVAMSAQNVDPLRPLGSGQIVTELLGEREGVFTIYGPQGYRKSLEATKVTWGAVAHSEGERAIWVGFDLSSLREGRPRVVATRNMRVIQHNLVGGQRRDTTFVDAGRAFLRQFWGDDTGSIPLDYDAHMTQANTEGFSPSSPKAFCTFANLGVATLAGMGVEWLFSGDEENGGYHTRAEVGFWRHVATALATGLTSTLFSNGRISMTQALESYTSGMLTSLPIDFGFNAAGLGSSPFGFALSYVANHFGDHVLEAVSKINPFARSVVTTAGLALFLGSTIYSYTTETRQNDARQSGMV